jgi:hypothetical protein
MTIIPEVSNLASAVIGAEMDGRSFKIAGGQYGIRLDPASSGASLSAAGLKITAGAAVPSVVSTFAFDALAKTITVAVDGTASKVIDLAALDNTGVKLVLNGQNLELQDSTGKVLSSSPISQVGAQQLAGVASAAGYKVSLSNGGSATITCADIGQMYASGASTAATELLSKDCRAVTISGLPISPGQLTPGILPAGVLVPPSALPLGIVPWDCAKTLSCLTPGSIDPAALKPGALPAGVTVPASALPPAAAPWDCTKTLSCLTPGSIDPAALKPGALPAGVTVPAAQIVGVIPAAPIAAGPLPANITLSATQIVGVIPAANLPPAAAGPLPANVTLSATQIVGVIPAAPIAAGPLPANVTLSATQIVGVIPAANLPSAVPPTNSLTIGGTPSAPTITSTVNGVSATTALPAAGSSWDCPKTLACLTPGSVPTSALAPGVLPAGVTIPTSALPVTTNLLSVGGTAAAPTLTSLVNGIQSVVMLPAAGSGWDCLKTLACLTPGSIDPAALKPGALPTGVTIPTSALPVTTNLLSVGGTAAAPTLTSLVNGIQSVVMLPAAGSGWDCLKTLACLTPGSVPAAALAPGALPAGVTVPASALPPTTVAASIAGTGTGRTLTIAVNGVPAAPVPLPDLDAQTLSIGGTSADPTLSISNGNTVKLPTSAVAHVNSWTRVGGLAESVNGASSNIVISAGCPTDLIGYDATGAVVYAPVKKYTVLVPLYGTATGAVKQAFYPPIAGQSTFVDEWTYDSVIELTAATTVQLVPPPAALITALGVNGPAMVITTEVKASGPWAGNIVVSGPPNIDNAPSYTFIKSLTTQPSRTFVWTGGVSGHWIIV